MDCIYNNINCEFVCSEFVLGSSSNLFLGKLEFYEKM